ncbi:MAG TPA: hypothetical protein VFA81_01855 [Burkholderiales bacterium]|nr:hypothetical protein [Burkholderiales bacterium]
MNNPSAPGELETIFAPTQGTMSTVLLFATPTWNARAPVYAQVNHTSIQDVLRCAVTVMMRRRRTAN